MKKWEAVLLELTPLEGDSDGKPHYVCFDVVRNSTQ